MIGWVVNAWDNLFGRGDAAVTVPPLDGAMRPNRKLDEASTRLPLAGVQGLTTVGDQLLATAGREVHALSDDGQWVALAEYPQDIACITGLGDTGQWAVALVTGEIVLHADGQSDHLVAENTFNCVTAMVASGTELYVANGSDAHPTDDWQTDLLQRNATGSIWRIDLSSGQATKIVDGLAWPAGLAVDDAGLVYAEAWKHRLVRQPLLGGATEVLYSDLPGYPGHIAADSEGYWLSVFAPRSQLVEFVQREPAYRQQMIAEIPRAYWIAPKFRSGRDFYEPLQGGGVKTLGILKPWAPTLSAGLCVRLGYDFQPQNSLHSRADGATHGITSTVVHKGRVYAASRGDDVVVSLGPDEIGDVE